MIHLDAIDSKQCKILDDLEDFDKCCELFAKITDNDFDFNKYSKEVFDKYKNDVNERIEFFKGIIGKYWKVRIYYKGMEFANFLFYPYRFIEGNSTLFTITATSYDDYAFSVGDKSYDIDNYDGMLQREMDLTEISKQDFDDFVEQQCHSVLEYRLRREKELNNSNDIIIIKDEL